MLILTRRIGETLMIGDEVTVTVLGVKGNQVRIGVNAPKDVAVRCDLPFSFRPRLCYYARDFWRGGRVAEGAPLLRAYRRNLIEGSNPSLSAKFQVSAL